LRLLDPLYNSRTSPNSYKENAMEYRVIWSIDVDADSPEDAAQKALESQRDPASIATCFVIRDSEGKQCEVDLGKTS